MTTHLEVMDLWEVVGENYDILELPSNPTMAQMKNHKERKTRKVKAKNFLFSTMTKIIFTRIMNFKSTKENWDYLKSNIKAVKEPKASKCSTWSEFKMRSMKETKTIKGYVDRILSIANKVQLLRKDFSNERIVQKILVIVLEKYESKISMLEKSKDLSTILLVFI